MQVVLLQSLYGDLVAYVTEAKAEVRKEQLDEIRERVKKEFPAYSDFEVRTAYILYDYRIAVQLYNEKVRRYVFVIL